MVGDIVVGTFLVVDTFLVVAYLATTCLVELARIHRFFHLHHDQLGPLLVDPLAVDRSPVLVEGTFQVIAYLVVHTLVVHTLVVGILVIHKVDRNLVHHRGAQLLSQ